MPNFSIEDIARRMGCAEDFHRVLGLQASITRRTETAVAARVGSAFDSIAFDVMVSADLEGRCPCPGGAIGNFCDHMAAAALEWILEGPGRELVPYEPAKRDRFT